MCQALLCGVDHAAGRYGDARIGSRTKIASSRLFARPWLADPDLLDHVPIRFVALLTSRQLAAAVASPSADCCRRFPVVSFVRDHRPDRARHLVGESDGNEHARLARQHAGQPRAGRAAAPPPGDDRHRADDQQFSRSAPISVCRRWSVGAARARARRRSPARVGSSPWRVRRSRSPWRSPGRCRACGAAGWRPRSSPPRRLSAPPAS
jgi:hypothetical protein